MEQVVKTIAKGELLLNIRPWDYLGYNGKCCKVQNYHIVKSFI